MNSKTMKQSQQSKHPKYDNNQTQVTTQQQELKNTQKNIELIEARTLRNPKRPKCLNHDWQTPVAQNITKPTIYFLYFFLLSLSLSPYLSPSYIVALFAIIHGGTNTAHNVQITKKRASHVRIKVISLLGSKIPWHSTMLGVVHVAEEMRPTIIHVRGTYWCWWRRRLTEGVHAHGVRPRGWLGLTNQ